MAEQKKQDAVQEKAQASKELENKSEQSLTTKGQSKSEKKKKAIWPVRAAKRIAKWFRDFKSEGKKVVWPSGKQVVNNTIVVIIAVVVVCIFVYILDITFGFVRDIIASLA